MENQKRILMIEDDPSTCKAVRTHLEREGFSVHSTPSGVEGLAYAVNGDCDLVLLDLGIEELHGIEVCKRIREACKWLPVIMLTSRADEIDRVLGLELGADDYVTKPFSLYELTARIRAQLRKLDFTPQDNGLARENNSTLSIGDLQIDLMRRRVLRANKLIELTPKEFDVLAFLAQSPGRPFSREQLLESVWNVTAVGYADTVGVLILRLRRKIETSPEEPEFILTVRGIGYRFVEAHELHEAKDA